MYSLRATLADITDVNVVRQTQQFWSPVVPGELSGSMRLAITYIAPYADATTNAAL